MGYTLNQKSSKIDVDEDFTALQTTVTQIQQDVTTLTNNLLSTTFMALIRESACTNAGDATAKLAEIELRRAEMEERVAKTRAEAANALAEVRAKTMTPEIEAWRTRNKPPAGDPAAMLARAVDAVRTRNPERAKGLEDSIATMDQIIKQAMDRARRFPEWTTDSVLAALADGTSLKQAKLNGLDFAGRDLAGADLSETRLKGTRLGGACLDRANLTNADLRDADLSNASLVGAELGGANLSGARLEGAVFTEAKLAQTIFKKLDLTNADFTGCTGEGADFTEAVLVGSRFRNALLNRAQFGKSDVTRELEKPPIELSPMRGLTHLSEPRVTFPERTSSLQPQPWHAAPDGHPAAPANRSLAIGRLPSSDRPMRQASDAGLLASLLSTIVPDGADGVAVRAVEWFGSFAAALSQPASDLLKVAGLGPHSVAAIKLAHAAALRLSRASIMDQPATTCFDALIG